MLKALIIDDCDALRPLYARTLATAFPLVQCLEAADLDHARGLLADHGDVDLVLCDGGLLDADTEGVDARWFGVQHGESALPAGLGGRLPKPFLPRHLTALELGRRAG